MADEVRWSQGAFRGLTVIAVDHEACTVSSLAAIVPPIDTPKDPEQSLFAARAFIGYLGLLPRWKDSDDEVRASAERFIELRRLAKEVRTPAQFDEFLAKSSSGTLVYSLTVEPS